MKKQSMTMFGDIVTDISSIIGTGKNHSGHNIMKMSMYPHSIEEVLEIGESLEDKGFPTHYAKSGDDKTLAGHRTIKNLYDTKKVMKGIETYLQNENQEYVKSSNNGEMKNIIIDIPENYGSKHITIMPQTNEISISYKSTSKNNTTHEELRNIFEFIQEVEKIKAEYQ